MDDESEVIARKPVCDELCRLCANTDKQLIPIFQGEGVEHNLSDQIKKYLPIIKVTEIDKLPLQVCYQCTSTLIAWHNFFEQCRVADSRLREILPSSEKFNQDDDPYHDYTDDFRDDSESQSPVIEKKDEASVTVSIIDSSQRMETNDIVSSIKSKEDDKSEPETLCENRNSRMGEDRHKTDYELLMKTCGRLTPELSAEVKLCDSNQMRLTATIPFGCRKRPRPSNLVGEQNVLSVDDSLKFSKSSLFGRRDFKNTDTPQETDYLDECIKVSLESTTQNCLGTLFSRKKLPVNKKRVFDEEKDTCFMEPTPSTSIHEGLLSNERSSSSPFERLSVEATTSNGTETSLQVAKLRISEFGRNDRSLLSQKEGFAGIDDISSQTFLQFAKVPSSTSLTSQDSFRDKENRELSLKSCDSPANAEVKDSQMIHKTENLLSTSFAAENLSPNRNPSLRGKKSSEKRQATYSEANDLRTFLRKSKFPSSELLSCDCNENCNPLLQVGDSLRMPQIFADLEEPVEQTFLQIIKLRTVASSVTHDSAKDVNLLQQTEKSLSKFQTLPYGSEKNRTNACPKIVKLMNCDGTTTSEYRAKSCSSELQKGKFVVKTPLVKNNRVMKMQNVSKYVDNSNKINFEGIPRVSVRLLPKNKLVLLPTNSPCVSEKCSIPVVQPNVVNFVNDSKPVVLNRITPSLIRAIQSTKSSTNVKGMTSINIAANRSQLLAENKFAINPPATSIRGLVKSSSSVVIPSTLKSSALPRLERPRKLSENKIMSVEKDSSLTSHSNSADPLRENSVPSDLHSILRRTHDENVRISRSNLSSLCNKLVADCSEFSSENSRSNLSSPCDRLLIDCSDFSPPNDSPANPSNLLSTYGKKLPTNCPAMSSDRSGLPPNGGHPSVISSSLSPDENQNREGSKETVSCSCMLGSCKKCVVHSAKRSVGKKVCGLTEKIETNEELLSCLEDDCSSAVETISVESVAVVSTTNAENEERGNADGAPDEAKDVVFASFYCECGVWFPKYDVHQQHLTSGLCPHRAKDEQSTASTDHLVTSSLVKIVASAEGKTVLPSREEGKGENVGGARDAGSQDLPVGPEATCDGGGGGGGGGDDDDTTHADEKGISCGKCPSKRFMSTYELKWHEVTVHMVGARVIDDDPQVNMQKYSTLVNGEPCLKCDKCDFVASFVPTLRYHLQQHAHFLRYECASCQRPFREKTSLANHILKKHEKLGKFKCDVCERRFMSRDSMSDHRNGHFGTQPYKCDECGKGFSHRARMYAHRKLHTGDGPCSCPHCELRFLCRSQLKLHMKEHEDGGTFKCFSCKEVFPTQDKLWLHLAKHADKDVFVCHVCGKEFKMKMYMTRHIRKVHEKKKAISSPLDALLK